MTQDIARRAKNAYMLQVSNYDDDETRSNLNDFMEQYRSIDITISDDADSAREKVRDGVRHDNPMVVVHKFHKMDDEMQKFLAQYLKGTAESHTELPIIVFDEEGGNLFRANPDLSGRVYSL